MTEKLKGASTAFVLSGGGSLGAVQVGMLQTLAEREIRPDLLVGTSVGALNAAFIARNGFSSRSVDELAKVWRGLRRRDVFPMNPQRLIAAAVGRCESLCPDGSLRRLIFRHVGSSRLEDLGIPIHVVATNVADGSEVLLSEGSAVEAIMASAAIPAVFPSVDIGGATLIDGGVANNAPISQALRLGAEVVYVLPTGYSCALAEPPSTPLSSALHALTQLVEQRLIVEVAHLSGTADIRVVPPLCPLAVSSADFRHGATLIERARTATSRWLDSGGTEQPDQEQFLSMHHHGTMHSGEPHHRGSSRFEPERVERPSEKRSSSQRPDAPPQKIPSRPRGDRPVTHPEESGAR